ncbi:8528_t:CDS:2 [Diversispora eburnea]|uniref:8528_t:CDS:1 n=1 Tax=Diversispora eburnea TaxID=1213867 RepID=A0A9N8V4F7_9GLOM|nr:8528_t:CDS:2 [Diversispora eburnea]
MILEKEIPAVVVNDINQNESILTEKVIIDDNSNFNNNNKVIENKLYTKDNFFQQVKDEDFIIVESSGSGSSQIETSEESKPLEIDIIEDIEKNSVFYEYLDDIPTFEEAYGLSPYEFFEYERYEKYERRERDIFKTYSSRLMPPPSKFQKKQKKENSMDKYFCGIKIKNKLNDPSASLPEPPPRVT